MALSKGKLIGLVVAVIVVIAVLAFVAWTIGTYNKLVSQNESIDSQWAQVANEYQRKVDLIPQLVATAWNYTEFEKSTLTNITMLRSRWMNANSTEDQVNASNELDNSLRGIFITVEAYPTLLSEGPIRDLMVDLEGTQNRIAVERMRYNDDVRVYNAHLKSFPASWVAGWGGFEARSYYSSTAAPPLPT
jgi:LemA protein